ELGIEIEVLELMDTMTHEYPDKTVYLKFFRCTWKQHEPRKLGCPDFRWIEREELTEFAFPAADARLLVILKETPGFWGCCLGECYRPRSQYVLYGRLLYFCCEEFRLR